ncbi:hypothetical protein AB0C98_25800 [Streptomyces sp. NPDC048558]|uniref:hypothetical protein n=1 Tax=Streptomyces sp. NPDC048558 TaxID=3155759 RepID=UPI00344807CE
MNVLLCATCGTRLTEPVRQLDEMPACPGWDGFADPDEPRPGPASVPRGTYAVDPYPFGAPYVPYEGPAGEYDGVSPGGGWKSDARGPLVSAGSRGTYVLHPLDAVGLDPHADGARLIGCCGPDGTRGVNHVCACGAEVAIVATDCYIRYETRLVPDAVRVEAVA